MSISNLIQTIQFNQILPTKEKSQQIFWGLGDNFWKQMIDGKFHQFGPMVFDEGLHKGPKEPGFFASLKEGCTFASEHLTEKLTKVEPTSSFKQNFFANKV
jgi:hypothetical protein